ncbi:hypothetical protein F2Q70_00029963 [Brassica cretica]|uniref:Uncharacterized protein n=1 Tax=Brassica cretica TaxID=69181 RepID=A0A8S9FKD8_BRACR|nr:hypothetical protein F2Q70_00029963 [Brassica cretica]
MLTSSYPFLTPTEISDDFGAFWRYLEQAPEMTIEIDYQPILKARLVTADLKPKTSPFYKITPDEFYPNYISFAAMLEAKFSFIVLLFSQQRYMPIITRSNKETQLLFLPDPEFGTLDPQGSALIIDRQEHFCVAPILAHPCRPTTQTFCRPTSSTRHRSTFHLGHRSILSRETWLRL